MNFIIHVGPHKTGSTYIQRCLDACCVTFQHQGIAVPTNWRDSERNPSHTGLVQRLTVDRSHEVAQQFAIWQSDGYSTVAISTEELVNTSSESLMLLRNAIGSDPVTLVYYVRAWPELIYSVWNEVIVHGGTETLPEFVCRNLAEPINSPHINISVGLTRFEKIFGPDSIRLISYNSIVKSKLDLFTHFTKELLGTPIVRPARPQIVNPSFSASEAELVRILNCIHQAAGNSANAHMAEAYRHRALDVNVKSVLDRIGEFACTFEIDNSKEPISNILESNYLQYRTRLVPPTSVNRIYPPKRTVLSYMSGDYLLDQSIVSDIKELRAILLGQPIRRPSIPNFLLRRRANP